MNSAIKLQWRNFQVPFEEDPERPGFRRRYERTPRRYQELISLEPEFDAIKPPTRRIINCHGVELSLRFTGDIAMTEHEFPLEESSDNTSTGEILIPSAEDENPALWGSNIAEKANQQEIATECIKDEGEPRMVQQKNGEILVCNSTEPVRSYIRSIVLMKSHAK